MPLRLPIFSFLILFFQVFSAIAFNKIVGANSAYYQSCPSITVVRQPTSFDTLVFMPPVPVGHLPTNGSAVPIMAPTGPL